METVLTAIVIIFVVLFAVLTLSDAFIGSQEMLQASWKDMQDRVGEQARTGLVFEDGLIVDGGSTAYLTIKNNGATRLADYSRWDIIVEYSDNHDPAAYHITRLAYSGAPPASNRWSIDGLFQDAAQTTVEAFEPLIFNPGEFLRLKLMLNPPVGIGKTLQAAITTANGIGASAVVARNIPPVVAVNTGLAVSVGSSKALSASHLFTLDPDNVPADLVYTVTTPPATGTLNLGSSFTQADIDGGKLVYSHSGGGDDSFAFTVGDGVDTIAEQLFVVTTTQPPALTINNILTLASGETGLIDATLLAVSDVDTLPENLVFTVTTFPARGTLSFNRSFTQADINNGLLTYTHTGVGSDSFVFSISDGEAVIGNYTFTIAVS